MNSTTTRRAKKSRPKKPSRPTPDFPLFPHANGQWAKKIKGKQFTFGRWADPDAALKRYLDERDDLENGRVPQSRQRAVPENTHRSDDVSQTVESLCDLFMEAKERRLKTGDLKLRSWYDYLTECKRVTALLGANRDVESLEPIDFDILREKLAEGVGPTVFGKRIRFVCMLLKYAREAGLVKRVINKGANFNGPTPKRMRQMEQKKKLKHGKRMFEAADLRWLIWSSDPVMRAMILLGANCGFGQTDISELDFGHIDPENAMIDFPRPKTAVERRCALWPETVEALREAIELRPEPWDPVMDGEAVFITCAGHRWTRMSTSGTNAWHDAVAQQFSKYLRALGLKRPGLNFYGLRHTFRTAADPCRDLRAIQKAMGHTAVASDPMGSIYVEEISDERLRAVADHVRAWLWPQRVAAEQAAETGETAA